VKDPAKLFLTTYPRCASNFFVDYLEQAYGVVFTRHFSGARVGVAIPGNPNFIKTHSMDKNQKNQVSIIRDPAESLVSIMAMENTFFERSLLEIAHSRLIEYIEYYSYLLKYVDIIYTYEDVSQKTKMVAEDIAKRLKIKIIDYEYVSGTDRNHTSNTNVSSSKTLPNYEDSIATLPSLDHLLFTAKLIYDMVKEKAIAI